MKSRRDFRIIPMNIYEVYLGSWRKKPADLSEGADERAKES